MSITFTAEIHLAEIVLDVPRVIAFDRETSLSRAGITEASRDPAVNCLLICAAETARGYRWEQGLTLEMYMHEDSQKSRDAFVETGKAAKF